MLPQAGSKFLTVLDVAIDDRKAFTCRPIDGIILVVDCSQWLKLKIGRPLLASSRPTYIHGILFCAPLNSTHDTTMSVCQKATRPLKRCLRQSQSLFNGSRNFTSSAKNPEEASLQVDSSTATTTKTYDPSTTSTRKGVRELLKRGIQPIGSRRRRAALSSSPNIPFEQLPYQCFQEARKILQADREEKLQQIETERGRITRFQARDASEFKGGEQEKLTKLDTMQKQVERLKILADINDPLIKRRFEDGMGKFI